MAAHAAASGMGEGGMSMPALLEPTDRLRRGGARFLEHEAMARHPVDVVQRRTAKTEWNNEVSHVERVYGPGQAMRLRMERAMLAQFQRVPGLPSDFAGLDAYLRRDTKIGFEDVLDVPETRPDWPKLTVHEALERKLGHA